jgi:uncharacterized protein with ParB-like and HNH nuclease domain
MSMNAHSMPFSKILSSDQGAREHYHVPKYQREYCWGKAEWEQLLQDIDENDSEYFMGSIICVHDGEPPSPGDEVVYEVVDGQQRLTTLSLLMMAIYKHLSALEETTEFEDSEDRQEFQNTLANLRNKLVKKKKHGESANRESAGWVEQSKVCFLRVQPSAQNKNLEDYKYLLGELGIIKGREKPKYLGVRSLSKAYKFFYEEIPSEIDDLLALVAKINQLTFVHISVPSQADAFTLFETLNNRGVPLSAIDIIKNKMLAEMEKQHKVDVDESFERWQEIVDSIPDASDQERFLRHFYNAFRWDPSIRVEGISRAIKSKIIAIYEKKIKAGASAIFDRLCTAAPLYGRLIEPDDDDFDKPVVSLLVDLARINGTPAYQILLYLFLLPKKQIGESDFLQRAVDLLQRFYVRRNVTDFPVTRDLDQAHMDLIEACHKRIQKGHALTFQFFKDRLLVQDGFADKDRFATALSGDMYATNSWMTRFLLVKIDETHRSKEYAPDLWLRTETGKRSTEKYVWTVEHVLPQTENISDAWINMIAGGDKELAGSIHVKQVHKLGNLTLSGYNPKLSTAEFRKKQALSERRKLLGQSINIGYKNGLALNNLVFKVGGKEFSLSTAPEWNEEMITARTKRICSLLLQMYKFEGVD